MNAPNAHPLDQVGPREPGQPRYEYLAQVVTGIMPAQYINDFGERGFRLAQMAMIGANNGVPLFYCVYEREVHDEAHKIPTDRLPETPVVIPTGPPGILEINGRRR